MHSFRFAQVNVFSTDPLSGNPLAVVHAAEGLSEARMAALARWTNLSETTFLLPTTDPDADYRVRISHPAASFLSPGTQRSAHATAGSPRAASRASRVLSCSSAAWASSVCVVMVHASSLLRRPCVALARSTPKCRPRSSGRSP